MGTESTLHLVCGLPATGKSTFARQLAAQKGGMVLDLDTFSEPIVQAGLKLAGHDPDDRDSAVYKAAFRAPVYRALFDVAKANLPNQDVIIVAPFSRELRQSDWAEKVSCSMAAQVKVYVVTCSEVTRKQRMLLRGNPRDKAKLDSWQAYIQSLDKRPPGCKHERINTDTEIPKGSE